jgi:hypothetical protein
LSNHVKYIIKMAFRQVSVFRKLKLRVSWFRYKNKLHLSAFYSHRWCNGQTCYIWCIDYIRCVLWQHAIFQLFRGANK